MKKPQITLLLFLFCLPLFGQEYTIGARGGLNTYTIGDINSRGGSIQAGTPDVVFQPNKDINFQFGGYFNVSFGKFFIQPELNYVSIKNHYDFPDQKANWNTSKIDFPILLGYEVFDPVSIYAGPGFSFFDDYVLDGVQVTSFSDGGPDHDKSQFSINFGVLVRLGRFGLDLRYEAFQKETEEELLDIIRSSYGVNLADLRAYKPNMLSLSVYVDIFRTDNEDIGGLFSGLFKSNKCWCPS